MAVTKELVQNTLDWAKRLHHQIITSSKQGEYGVRDEGGLYHSLSKVLSKSEHSDPRDLAAFIYKEFATRHHFNDGNKRFSHVYAKLTLLRAGYHLSISYRQATQFITCIAAGTLSLSEIKDWILRNIQSLPSESPITFKIEDEFT